MHRDTPCPCFAGNEGKVGEFSELGETGTIKLEFETLVLGVTKCCARKKYIIGEKGEEMTF